MQKLISTAFSFILIAGLCSCTSLKSKCYPGEAVMNEDKNIGKDMVCTFNKAVYSVRAVKKDETVMGHLEWDKEKGEYKVVNNKAVLSKLDNYLFVNVLGDDGLYTILKIAASGEDSLVLYSVKKDKVEADIKAGRIRGLVKDQNIILDLAQEELDDYLRKNIGTAFDYNSPGVVLIIKNFEN